MSRKLEIEFLEDLQQGKLAELTRKIRRDDTLMLALRGKTINVYYRGGNILRLEKSGSDYIARFDANYAMGETLPQLPTVISAPTQCLDWVTAMPQLKEFMNSFLSVHTKSEREFQQLVAWENNRSPISNSTEYFITDIEYADVRQSARLDMLGLRWLSKSRKDGSACTPVFIEMKYGIDAYDGDAGIIKHVEDLEAILGDPVRLDALREMIADQFNQLALLDLIRFNRSETIETISVGGRPEVVFLLANHNPRSRKLLNILSSVDEPKNFDLRFFTAAFAGYGMHQKCMVTLDQFRCQLESAAATDMPR